MQILQLLETDLLKISMLTKVSVYQLALGICVMPGTQAGLP